MKRSLSFSGGRELALVSAGTCLIAGTYGLVRLAYGLFLPDIQASLSMSSAVAGYVSSAASVAYIVGAVFGLTAANQSRRLVLGAILTASVGSGGMALAPDLTLFVPFAVLSSTAAGLASPGMVAVVARNVASPRTDRGQAVVNSGTGPGLVAAGLLALLLLPQWRLGFAVSAAFTTAAGIGVLLLDRPAPAGSARSPRARPPRRPYDWLRALVTPAVAATLLGAASVVVWTYGRTQLVEQGASDAASTVAWVALGIGGAATILTTRPLASLHPARAWTLTVGTVAAAIVALGLTAGRLPVALLACAVFGWAFVAATSALIAWTTRVVPDRAAAGTSTLFITLVVGQAAGSSVAGVVAERRGLSSAFVLAAAVALLAAVSGRHQAPSARDSSGHFPAVQP